MNVRVLGCSGAIARNCRTTAFLIDANLLVDAGTGVGDLTLDEMQGVDHVLLTHSHLDHVAALPLMVDAIASQRQVPLQVYALRETLEALKAHVFNDVVWPDFTRIPTRHAPFIQFCEVAVGQVLQVGGKSVEVMPAVHSVPAVGYAVRTEGAHWVYTGDTAHNPEFWRRLNQMEVGMLVIETAFSRREHALAVRSKHLSPDVLVSELDLIDSTRKFPIYIMHTKPAETDLIMAEIQALNETRLAQARPGHDLHWLQAGQEFVL